MIRRLVLAAEDREYVAKLAEYLREEEKDWEVTACTYDGALRRELRNGGKIDALIGERGLVGQALSEGGQPGKTIILTDGHEAAEEGWQNMDRYQPLPALLSGIRGALGLEAAKLKEGCRIWTVFSASGGAGKTTVALNLVRQAGERGQRVLYLNLEELNATSLLFGRGEPDGLSRLLYALQARPEQWGELSQQLCRHQSQLRADYIDAPEHPGERLALTPELTGALLDKLKSDGRYDAIVVDPDSGSGEWHCSLLEASDRVVWLILDDAYCLQKAEKLLQYWEPRLGKSAYKLILVLNKAVGGQPVNRCTLAGAGPELALPYIPRWKAVDQPGRWLSSPVFSGAVDRLLDKMEPRTGGSAKRGR